MKRNGHGFTESELELIETLPAGMMVLDKDGGIGLVNKTMTSMTGLEAGKLKGKLIFDLVEPADIPSLLEIVKGQASAGSQTTRVSLSDASGSRIPMIGSFRWIGRSDSRKLIGTFIETTETNRSSHIPRRTMEDLPFPVSILNKRLEPIFQNSASDEQISLVSKGKDPIKYPKKDLKGLLLQALTEGKGGVIEVALPSHDGGRIFEVIVTPIFHGKDPDHVLEIWLDNTTTGRTSGEISLSKGLADELIETSNAIIIGIDMEGQIRLFNNGAKRALGYDPREVEGTVWFDYLVDADAEKGKLEVFQWNIGTGFRTQYESRVRSMSGQTMTILLENTIIFNREGEVSLVLMVGQDITRTKKLEQSLREQSEKLTDAMEELTLYNDLMIHDIHNANAGIQGYLELFEMEGISEDRKKDYVKRALLEVRKSSSIIKDVKVMSLSRPDFEPNPVDLDTSFERAICRWKETLEGKSVKPIIDREKIDLHVLADDLLEEALIRIFENTRINSSKDQFRISIEIGRDPSRSNLIPEPVHIAIKDDGGDISEEMKDALMERPTSTEWGSHMLGLYLVRKIIMRYNGLVWLERVSGGKELHIILSEAV